MNTIGIDKNLDRARIRKLLAIGLFGAVITGAGDFLLGFAEETGGSGFAAAVMGSAVNLTDSQMIIGALLGFFGIFLEGLAYFAVYRLMADAAPKYAHIFRAGIFGYIWLAPVGCHLNMGILNLAYKYLVRADADQAAQLGDRLLLSFSVPIYVLLVIFWLPMIVVQFRAFSEGLTPYPKKARWFNLIVGALPAFVISAVIGPSTALGAAIGTMFLSFGNAFIFGGLLATLPSQEEMDRFRENLV